MTTKTRVSRQQGFTLLEILVAFSILAISLGVTINIFSRGLRSAMISDQYVHAVAIAQSLLARTGVESELQESASSGVERQFQWFVRVTPYMTDVLPGADAQQQPTLTLYEIIVEVAWQEESENRSLVLTTLRMAEAG